MYFTIMHHADDLDVKIIKELGGSNPSQWNVRESYSNIAERLGIDEETVRRRLKRAERLGSLPGWKVMVSPRVLDCRAVNVSLRVKDERKKPGIISELGDLDGVIKILNFRGDELLLTLYYGNDDSLKNKLDLIASISDCPNPIVWELVFPEPQINITLPDWKIIESMLEDARKSLNGVSKSVVLSIRTVERRLNKLTEGYAVYLQGTPNFNKFAGLSCVFIVFCPDEKEKRTVDNTILSRARRIELANTSSRQYSIFVSLFDNLAEPDDFVGWINGLDGVKSVSMGIMKDLIVIQKWMRDEIIKRQFTK